MHTRPSSGLQTRERSLQGIGMLTFSNLELKKNERYTRTTPLLRCKYSYSIINCQLSEMQQDQDKLEQAQREVQQDPRGSQQSQQAQREAQQDPRESQQSQQAQRDQDHSKGGHEPHPRSSSVSPEVKKLGEYFRHKKDAVRNLLEQYKSLIEYAQRGVTTPLGQSILNIPCLEHDIQHLEDVFGQWISARTELQNDVENAAKDLESLHDKKAHMDREIEVLREAVQIIENREMPGLMDKLKPPSVRSHERSGGQIRRCSFALPDPQSSVPCSKSPSRQTKGNMTKHQTIAPPLSKRARLPPICSDDGFPIVTMKDGSGVTPNKNGNYWEIKLPNDFRSDRNNDKIVMTWDRTSLTFDKVTECHENAWFDVRKTCHTYYDHDGIQCDEGRATWDVRSELQFSPDGQVGNVERQHVRKM